MADETDNPTRAPDGRFLKGHSKPGPGRKTRAERHDYTPQVVETEVQLRDKLPLIVDAKIKSALEGFEQVTEVWKAAETVYAGKPPVRVYPADKYPDGTMIMVERRVTAPTPHSGDQTELLNRLLGKPRESIEIDTPPDSPLIAIFNASLGRIYGDKSDTGD